MNSVVSFARALADETRWRIVQLIFNEPMCVCELADILDMPQSSVSSHVQIIKKAGILESERCEKWIYYRVSASHRNLLSTIGGFFEVSPASDAILKADAGKAINRLAERNGSCCPLPRELSKLKPIGSKPGRKKTTV
ncbi:MAG: winged helix-turn-helix transcriptional regulator [Verrucomicrobiales bacterium]|nr:winged helix-turn-helix transcriptional regulator [Verrucomicrobiales bacterium]